MEVNTLRAAFNRKNSLQLAEVSPKTARLVIDVSQNEHISIVNIYFCRMMPITALRLKGHLIGLIGQTSCFYVQVCKIYKFKTQHPKKPAVFNKLVYSLIQSAFELIMVSR